MGQAESKPDFQKQYPFHPSDKDIETICRLTDLQKDEVLLCWDSVWLPAIKENGKVDYENFVKHLYQNLESLTLEDETETQQAFYLFDGNHDGWLEFVDFAIYLFSTREGLTDLQLLRRSYQFYDKDKSNSISKKDLVQTLLHLGKIEANINHNDGDVRPNEVEDTLNLIEGLDHGKGISNAEFLSANVRHKKVASLLAIDVLATSRLKTVIDLNNLSRTMKKSETRMSDSYVSLSDNKSCDGNENIRGSICHRLTPFYWICNRSRIVDRSNDINRKDHSNYGSTMSRCEHPIPEIHQQGNITSAKTLHELREDNQTIDHGEKCIQGNIFDSGVW